MSHGAITPPLEAVFFALSSSVLFFVLFAVFCQLAVVGGALCHYVGNIPQGAFPMNRLPQDFIDSIPPIIARTYLPKLLGGTIAYQTLCICNMWQSWRGGCTRNGN